MANTTQATITLPRDKPRPSIAPHLLSFASPFMRRHKDSIPGINRYHPEKPKS